ncbi:ankyrin repeat-containing protein BDA1-like [Actinidia eriantha]|uniref:ankyrin repeat-containing protein BDA1-like n=1 Tax=Actinidia eriantha TaxID=165200 RepID=UPI00258E5054|nr:ankyrin repeat-containing protein BDA1-like [Actinidia eriantha]
MVNKELVKAAQTGNIEVLHKMLQENPLMLAEATLSSPEPILLVATKARQLNFVRELIKHDPDAPRELSNDGFRAMDVASGIGDVEIVKELLKVGAANCRLKGKDGRTAIHYAAAKGRVEVIHQLLESCPDSVNDVTAFGETALHLAVKSHQFDAFRALIQWAERLGFETIVNWPDHDGNTVLHLAASRKQVETIELLLGKSNAGGGILEVNATNSKGLTPMDVLDIIIESPEDVALKEILQRFGAVIAQDVRAVTPSPTSSRQQIAKVVPTNLEPPSDPSKNWFEYFKFKPSRDSPSDARNVLLIVAALIATVTFQAGVNPPSSVLETNNKSAADTTSGNQTPLAPPPPPMFNPTITSGVATVFAITGSGATPYLFLFANSLGFTASLSIIIYLTGGFPFQRELLIAIYAMMFTYGFSVSSITDKEVVTYVILGIASVLPFSLRWLPWWGAKAWNYWRRRHHANLGLSRVPKMS